VEPWNATNKTVTWNKGETNPNVIASFSPATTQSGASVTITAASSAGSTSFYASQGAVRSEEIDFNIRTFPASQNVSTITLNITNMELAVGNTATTLVPTVLPATATDPRLRWISSNSAIAEVDEITGMITGRGAGTAVITVNSINGKSASCTVAVYAPNPRIPLTGISIPATYNQPDNTTMLLPFVLTPANATSPGMTWTSSDTTVATVTNNGMLTSLKPGTTTVSVKTLEVGFAASCVVTVTRVPVTGVTLNRNTRIELDPTGPRGETTNTTFQLTATVVPSNATDKTLTWVSSNTSVATVSAAGLITAVGNGSATITVTTNTLDGARTATCPVFVWLFRQIRINATGTDGFLMGSPNSEASRQTNEMQHRVNITEGFYMGQYTVTSDNYNKVMGTRPANSSGNQPVGNVNWYDAIVFCNRLSELEGLTPAYRINGTTNTSTWGAVPTAVNATWDAATIVAGSTGYRLPTEAQWEYACRAGTTTAWFGGNTWNHNWGVVLGGSTSGIQNVGTKTPNAWQLYDMHGNVFEWCWDWYGEAYYEESPRNDPTGAASGSYRVRRGGVYGGAASYARSAYRNSVNPNSRSADIGFRLVRP
jgi:formylglycine-generating enzyme required for sulfatase activity